MQSMDHEFLSRYDRAAQIIQSNAVKIERAERAGISFPVMRPMELGGKD
jgi:hypothetical protein